MNRHNLTESLRLSSRDIHPSPCNPVLHVPETGSQDGDFLECCSKLGATSQKTSYLTRMYLGRFPILCCGKPCPINLHIMRLCNVICTSIWDGLLGLPHYNPSHSLITKSQWIPAKPPTESHFLSINNFTYPIKSYCLNHILTYICFTHFITGMHSQAPWATRLLRVYPFV